MQFFHPPQAGLQKILTPLTCRPTPYCWVKKVQPLISINDIVVFRLMSTTAKIPQLTDVFFELEDAREDIQNGFADVGKSILQMKAFIGKALGKLEGKMNRLFKIQNFQTTYAQRLQNMHLQIRQSKSLFDTFGSNSKKKKDRAIRLAKRLLLDGKILDWEMILNDIFKSVQGGFSITTVDPLMLLVINMYKDQACVPENKKRIDQLLQNFMLLQYELYLMHTSVTYILGYDATKVGDKYNKTIDDQVCRCMFDLIAIDFTL